MIYRLKHGMYALEWVSYSEVNTLCFLELRYVEETRFASLVWSVEGEAPVYSQYEKVEIVTETTAYVNANISLLWRTEVKGFTRLGCVRKVFYLFYLIAPCVVHVPYVARVKEQCTVKRTKEVRAIFKIHDKFEVAVMIVVGKLFVFEMYIARTYAAHTEATQVVGTTSKELFGIWHTCGVTIVEYGTTIEMGNDAVFVSEVPGLSEVCFYFEVL